MWARAGGCNLKVHFFRRIFSKYVDCSSYLSLSSSFLALSPSNSVSLVLSLSSSVPIKLTDMEYLSSSKHLGWVKITQKQHLRKLKFRASGSNISQLEGCGKRVFFSSYRSHRIFSIPRIFLLIAVSRPCIPCVSTICHDYPVISRLLCDNYTTYSSR